MKSQTGSKIHSENPQLIALAQRDRVLAVPTPRCCHELADRGQISFCGLPAKFTRFEPEKGFAFVCERHRGRADRPIVGELAITLVALHVDALFCGVVGRRRVAQAEAIDRLAAAVEAVGGLVSLRDTSCRLVRCAALPAWQGFELGPGHT